MQIYKTVFLMTVLTLLLVGLGWLFGGQSGMLIAFVIACCMNAFGYYFSDTLVLKHYKAIEVNEENAKGLLEIVRRLTKKANLPMPKVYIIPDNVPNAFATGRNHSHSAVAVTEGLLALLDENEIEGVLAHELSHIKHYDILTGSIAATISGAIMILANFIKYGAMFNRNNRESNPFVAIGIAIIMPIAATVIQMAISRNREYLADEGAARLTQHPEWLQSALLKLNNLSKNKIVNNANAQSAHMFIVNPFGGKKRNLTSLFLTHPSVENRVERLEEIKRQITR